MPYRYNYCPICEKKIVFMINPEDIDDRVFPAPVHVLHEDDDCNKVSTFYVDSFLRVSYTEPEKKTGAISQIVATSR